MNNTYKDLVHQTFNFPQEDYDLQDDYLQYNGVDVKALIDKYGTPLKFSFLPKIGMQIAKAKKCLPMQLKSTNTKESIFTVIAPKARIFLLLLKRL